ncbi:MAG TPA: DUF4139 domain-containing protein [Candidatus Polarisedimenticolia bacterium]|nr:DUF4139 domain-containing protein [Candidatus Polarisedimenticolia bacterium]
MNARPRAAAALLGAACLLAPAAVSGQTGPAARTSRAEDGRSHLAITVYNSNLGLVRETRRIELPAGVTELRYMDVAAQINPRTVHMASLTDPARLRVLEQNYEYDLISPEKLMERFLGRTITLVFGEGGERPQPRQEQAKLVSTNGGMVYEIGGAFHVNPPARPVLPEIPGGLISAPTLVWLLRSDRAGEHRVETSYLTGGLTWSADYVAILSGDDARLDLTGWVTLDNGSGASYHDAKLKLVAGDVHRAQPPPEAMAQQRTLAMAADEKAFAEESFFEYHLYTLERPATIKDRQTKQIQLLEGTGVPVKKIFLLAGQPGFYRGRLGQLGTDRKVAVELELANTKNNGLGMPLPGGIARLYKKDASGSLQFIGEDLVKHTPEDEKVTLHVGDAFDVVADRTQTDFRAVSAGRYDAEVAFQIRIRNHKDEPVTVTVREPVAGDWKILQASHPHAKLDAFTIEFQIPVAPSAEAVLEYRVAVDWR